MSTLVLGASGFLGSYFSAILGNEAIFHTSKTGQLEDNENVIVADFNNPTQIESVLNSGKFTKVINCIALASIEQCENNPHLASWLNSKIPLILSSVCLKNDIKFAHISTDAVFDGCNAPNMESEKVSPISNYGKTKAIGEMNVLETNPDAQIFRVNFFGKSPKKNSLFDYFFNNLKNENRVLGFTDVMFSPMSAENTARVICNLMDFTGPGIFHISGNSIMSKYEFGCKVASYLNVDEKLVSKSNLSSTPGGSIRSRNLCLNNNKIVKLGIKIENFDQELIKLVKLSL